MAGNIGGTVSTRREAPGNGDDGGAARYQGAKSSGEQLGQDECGRGGERLDRARQAGNIDGAVSTRREILGEGAATIGGNVLAERRAQGEDLASEEEWRRMSQRERRTFRNHRNKRN